jgi:excisionase family DNA binding protein
LRSQDAISVAEAAELCDVTGQTIRRWIEAGYFPGARRRGPGLTSPYLIPRSQVEALLDSLQLTHEEVDEDT